MDIIRSFFKAIQPVSLFACILIYSLGVGIIDYQNEPVDYRAYLLGQSWIIMVHLGQTFLSKFFSGVSSRYFYFTDLAVNDSMATGKKTDEAKVFGWGVLTSFAGAAVISVILIRYQLISLTGFLLIISILTVVILLSTPPFLLERSGYGEFLLSFWMILLIPAFAYHLQKGDNYRLLLFILLPLFFFHLSMQLVHELRSYQIYPEKPADNYFQRFGWRIGITTHNFAIIAGFLTGLIGAIWGLPKFTFFIGISLLPLGMFQLFQMRRILAGAKPLWKMIALAAYSLFFLGAYLLTYAYWMQ